MTVQLQMQNTNTEAVDVNIYRSNTVIDRTNLGTPIGTLTQQTASTLVFNDTTAVQDAFYYYVFETIGSKDRQISRNFYTQATRTRGEGPNNLQMGDDNLGYFGSIVIDGLINAAGLRSLINTQATGVIAPAVLPTFWHKFSRKGKVLFVPNSTVGTTLSFTQLSNAGAVNGTLVYNYNGNAYKVRLMSGFSDTGATPTYSATATDSDVLGNTCEFNDLVYPLSIWAPNGQKLPNVVQQTITQMGTDSNRVVLCAELTSNAAYSQARCSTFNSRAGIVSGSHLAVATAAATNAWWPVLELVEN